jgi:hypothetical protein
LDRAQHSNKLAQEADHQQRQLIQYPLGPITRPLSTRAWTTLVGIYGHHGRRSDRITRPHDEFTKIENIEKKKANNKFCKIKRNTVTIQLSLLIPLKLHELTKREQEKPFHNSLYITTFI